MTFYARTRDGAPEQLLKGHLQNVAGLAEGFARGARPGDEEFARAARWMARPARSIQCRPLEAEA